METSDAWEAFELIAEVIAFVFGLASWSYVLGSEPRTDREETMRSNILLVLGVGLVGLLFVMILNFINTRFFRATQLVIDTCMCARPLASPARAPARSAICLAWSRQQPCLLCSDVCGHYRTLHMCDCMCGCLQVTVHMCDCTCMTVYVRSDLRERVTTFRLCQGITSGMHIAGVARSAASCTCMAPDGSGLLRQLVTHSVPQDAAHCAQLLSRAAAVVSVRLGVAVVRRSSEGDVSVGAAAVVGS